MWNNKLDMKHSDKIEEHTKQQTTKSLSAVLDSIVDNYADDERISITPNEDSDGFEVEYIGKDSAWRTIIGYEDEQNNHKIMVVSILGISIPLEKRSPIAELIARINFYKDEAESTYVVMNMDDGELGILTSLPLMDGELTQAMLEKMLSSNLMVIAAYTSAIMKVVYCDATPLDVMKAIKEENLSEKTLH